MISRIYTTGYTGKNIDQLWPLIRSLDAKLVDIRYSPKSRAPQWRKPNLERILGRNYFHVPELGNRTYKEKRIEIDDMKKGIDRVLDINTSVVLMCVCENFESCHRKVVSDELRSRGFDPMELSGWSS